jgi:MFS transporter, MHS family, proline/betaine transporter
MTDIIAVQVNRPTYDNAAEIRNERSKIIFASGIGTAVEFFDFGIYGYLAKPIADRFFPSSSPLASLLAAFAVFAIAFFARPAGGILFGHIGDRVGRKTAMVWSIALMAGSTFAIGVLPDYLSIGVLAPALLVLLRLLQGLAAGGEIGGAATMLAEFSDDKNRGLFTSAAPVGGIVGLLLASIIILTMNAFFLPSAMSEWAWRITFIVALPTGLIGFYIRTRLHDTPVFESEVAQVKPEKIPLVEVLSENFGAVLKSVGVAAMAFAVYYLVFVYVATYLQTQGSFTRTEATYSTIAALCTAAVTIPLFGWLSDRIGRRAVIGISALCFLLFTIPLFGFMSGASFKLAISAHVLLSLFVAITSGPLWTTLAEMYPARIRYSGVGIAYNVTVALTGGTAPYIATWLVGETGNPISPSYYIMAMAAVTLIAVTSLSETARKPLLP